MMVMLLESNIVLGCPLKTMVMSSYIWRSILVAQHIIKDGIRVRIGDGTAIEI